jgi:ATP-dependent DNA helicase RecG
MSATPIPRSLALTLYGDLDLSVMDEMPAGRQPVDTYILNPLERERAYSMLRKNAEKGFQAFIVYPLIEQGDNDEVKAGMSLIKKYFRKKYSRILRSAFYTEK